VVNPVAVDQRLQHVSEVFSLSLAFIYDTVVGSSIGGFVEAMLPVASFQMF
jgi:hypothetical protein